MAFFKKRQPLPKQKDRTGSKGLYSDLDENILFIKQSLGNSDDLIMREIVIGKEQKTRACLFYISGLVDKNSIEDHILEAVMIDAFENQLFSTQQDFLRLMKDQILTAGEVKAISEFDSLFHSLLSGEVILLFARHLQGFSIGMTGGQWRGITESTTETVIRGPKESFTENIRFNTALIRRKIKTPDLWIETKQIGKLTKTDVAVMYIHEIANKRIVEEVHKRLDQIDIDGILESGYIEELIQDKTYSPFPTIFNSERPDSIAADLLEGKVAILVDGTPNVLVVPGLFVSFIQAAEDYYQRADISTLIRILRFFSIFIALLAPSLYIAVTTFHQEMLPTLLLINLAAQREGVPFPAFIEALMMEAAFEILREAGLRMPKALGAAISIVGTLVIGTAAVQAGIVSAAMVIIVAVTAISSFILPVHTMSMTIRMLRFPMMALAASFGLFGIFVGLIGLLLHMCSLRSFGVPYLTPFGPFNLEEMKDTFVRAPRYSMFLRPRLISQKNLRRTNTLPPAPSRKKD